MKADILIVDDEADIRSIISGILEDEGFETREAPNGETALESVQRKVPDMVILDIWMKDSRYDGLQVLELLKADHPDLPVVMISGHGTIESAVTAIRNGAYDFIEKPFQTNRLLLVIDRALEASRLKRENAELRSRAGTPSELLGNGPAIGALKRTISKVAPTGSRVLITGPAGAGKEVVARQIHALSPRSGNAFVVVNCAALSPERMDTELFGEEDPETGAVRRVGLIEKADGGTLLLDEVADMPLETQSRLLRVLQDNGFVRVGGTSTVNVDVRVMATTNRDLRGRVHEGTFREELYYRLSVVPVVVPALSDMREDIPELVAYFMGHAAQNAGITPRPLGQDALAAFQAYDWPGNLRQLRNVVEWLLIMAPGSPAEPVTADMLPVELNTDAPELLRLENATDMLKLPLRGARELFECEYLRAQLVRFGWNISRTAEFVGMERSALHRKLKMLGISSQEQNSEDKEPDPVRARS